MLFIHRLTSLRTHGVALALVLIATACAQTPQGPDPLAQAKARQWQAIQTGAFADSIHHALMNNEDEKAAYERYRPEQIIHIADNLRAWQNKDGGWPKNKDWLKVLTDKEFRKLPHGKSNGKSTLDNGSSWSQIDYLAHVRQETGLADFDETITHGIDYILNSQRSSGGWRGVDVEAITFNDDVMVGALKTLRDVIDDEALYGFVDADRRERAQRAWEKGIECILKCQIKVDGRLTAWCQQHSHKTFAPVWARSFEPPSITPGESVPVVQLLMEIDKPSPEVIEAVEAAVAWFDKVKIEGIRVDKIPAPKKHFSYHYSDYDLVVVEDPDAPPIWTRYYDFETEEPIFCTRRKEIVKTLAEVPRERRTGYAWYGYWPTRLYPEAYPAWQKKWVAQTQPAQDKGPLEKQTGPATESP